MTFSVISQARKEVGRRKKRDDNALVEISIKISENNENMYFSLRNTLKRENQLKLKNNLLRCMEITENKYLIAN